MLDHDSLRAYCLSKQGATSSFPFGPIPEVFKVMNKMFALMPLDEPSISLKCDPILAEMLRATYPSVKGAYHLNKRHWNSVFIDGSMPDAEVLTMIDDSYDLVVSGLTRKEREILHARISP